MAGGRAGEIGNLAADPEQREIVFQQLACAPVEFADAEDGVAGVHG